MTMFGHNREFKKRRDGGEKTKAFRHEYINEDRRPPRRSLHARSGDHLIASRHLSYLRGLCV